MTTAQDGSGMAEVVAELDKHAEWLRASGELARRRTRRAREEVEAIAVTTLRQRWAAVGRHDRLDALAVEVAEGRTDPYTAADVLLDAPESAG
jgi:LAO/AO transport system kinase